MKRNFPILATRYISLLILTLILAPAVPTGAQETTIDPSRQPTFKEPPLGGRGSARRGCISAPYVARGGALVKSAEPVPLPYVPKAQRVSATVTRTAPREIAATLYDIRLSATADSLGGAAADLAARRAEIGQALASLDLPGYDSFLLSADARTSEGVATASAVLRVELTGAPDPAVAARIAAAAGIPELQPAGMIFANAEHVAEDQRAELEAAVRAQATETAAARGQRLVELLESRLQPDPVPAFGRDASAAPVTITASATFRVAPDAGEADAGEAAQ